MGKGQPMRVFYGSVASNIPATQGKCSVTEIRPGNQKLPQKDLIEMHLLDVRVTQCRERLKESEVYQTLQDAIAARNAKREEIIRALERGVTVEDGLHEAFLKRRPKLVLA